VKIKPGRSRKTDERQNGVLAVHVRCIFLNPAGLQRRKVLRPFSLDGRAGVPSEEHPVPKMGLVKTAGSDCAWIANMARLGFQPHAPGCRSNCGLERRECSAHQLQRQPNDLGAGSAKVANLCKRFSCGLGAFGVQRAQVSIRRAAPAGVPTLVAPFAKISWRTWPRRGEPGPPGAHGLV